MEVQYYADADDYIAAQKYVCRAIARNSYWRFVPSVLGGVFGLCFALGAVSISKFYEKYEFLKFYELNWAFGAILLAFIVLILGLRAYGRAIKARMFSPEGLFRSLHKVRLTEDCLVVSVKNNKYTYTYSDVIRVEDDPDYVYVFIDNGAALYIPAKAFESAATKKAFINEFSSKIVR